MGKHNKYKNGDIVYLYEDEYEIIDYINSKNVIIKSISTGEPIIPKEQPVSPLSGSALKDVEKVYNEKKQAIEDKLNQQLEDNKDRLDDIDESYRDWETDRKSTRLNSSHSGESRMPSSA